jgi:hypothetical protein
MTSSEKVAWRGEAAKGAYNYTDLNRVESAVAEIAPLFLLSLTTKTDWGLWDIPTKADMDRYLNNVVAIRDACPGNVAFPTLPFSMSGLTFEGANNIEKVLELVYEEMNKPPVEPDEPDVPDIPDIPTTADYIRSGELYCGEV